MSELHDLKDLLSTPQDKARIATVTAILDGARCTVQFATGAYRRCFFSGDTPGVGDTVLVLGQHVISVVGRVNRVTKRIP